MNLLLDTQALIWFLEGDRRLSHIAQKAIEDDNNVKYVSIVSGWEMVIKSELGKLTLPISFQHLFPGKLQSLGLRILPVEPRHLHGLLGMARYHADPFDRLLIALLIIENFTSITSDERWPDYGVPILW